MNQTYLHKTYKHLTRHLRNLPDRSKGRYETCNTYLQLATTGGKLNLWEPTVHQTYGNLPHRKQIFPPGVFGHNMAPWSRRGTKVGENDFYKPSGASYTLEDPRKLQTIYVFRIMLLERMTSLNSPYVDHILDPQPFPAGSIHSLAWRIRI